MTENQPSIHIIVGYDFGETAQLALSRTLELAEVEPNHVLHILTVLDEDSDFRPSGGKGKLGYEDTVEVQDTLTKELDSRLSAHKPQTPIHFFVHVRLGKPGQEILRLAAEVGAHLILLGSHGRKGIRRVLMGSVSEQVVREAKCPVLVVREREYEDVELTPVVEAPPTHAQDSPYVQPHRYSYMNQLMERQKSSWPWY